MSSSEEQKDCFIYSRDCRAKQDFQLDIRCEFFKIDTLGKQYRLAHEISLKSFLDIMFLVHDTRTMIKWRSTSMFSNQKDENCFKHSFPPIFVNRH